MLLKIYLYHRHLCYVLHLYETIILMYTSIEWFISSSLNFRVLTVNEQYSLFELNLHGVIAFCSALFFRTTTIIDNPKCMETFVIVYGSEMMLQLKPINKKIRFLFNYHQTYVNRSSILIKIFFLRRNT